MCPSSDEDHSTDVLEDTISTLKRCLALTDKTNGSEESKGNTVVEETDAAISQEKVDVETNTSGLLEETCTVEGCQQNGAVVEAESQTIVSSIQPKRIRIVEYENEHQMGDIMRLITKVLSEPYSIYTYRYFIHNWPKLCLLAFDLNEKKYVGAIVCKLDLSRQNRRRGYIAMLAVDEAYRKMGIGTRLVQKAISNMQEMGCDQVVLETEVTNSDALRLYSNLGFIREKRLFRYYLNGVDAYRLKLFFTSVNEQLLLDPPVFGNTQCVK